MRIAIAGSGAMGSFLGGFFARAGLDVTLINPPSEHVRTIQAVGLTLRDGPETFTVPVKITTSPSTLQPVELIIILVKSYHTEKAVKDVLNLVGPSTYMLSLQNGIGHHLIMNKYVEGRKILLGSTSSGAYLSKPGQVTVAGKGETFIGAFTGIDPSVLEDIKNLFVTAGLRCTISEEILRIIWEKLIINVGINALTAITRLQNGKLLEYPELEQILEGAVREAVTVAHGQKMKITFPNPVEKVKEVARITAGNRSSMLQDIERKRPTEINVINGAIIEIGERLNLDVPINRTLFNLVKVLEKINLSEPPP